MAKSNSDMAEPEMENEYLATALRRSKFLACNDAKRANLEYDKLYRIRKNHLRLLPDRGEAVLKRISQNENPEVQVNAAADLLTVDESFAVELLKTIAQRKGPGSFTAEMTLREWSKGKLRDYLS